MGSIKRPPLAWAILGLLAALTATNAAFLALLQTGGPLIGLMLYAVLLWRWRQYDYQAAVVEVVTTGRSPYPVFTALNLLLPAVLVPVAWLADWQGRQ